LLDAAWTLDGDDVSWNGRIERALKPIAGGRPALSWTIDFASGAVAVSPTSDPRAARLLGMAHDLASPEQMKAAYGWTGVTSIASVLGPESFSRSDVYRRCLAPNGIADSGGIQFSVGARSFVHASLLDDVGAVSPALKRFGLAIACDLASAARLRAATHARPPAAVLDAEGRVKHATGRARAVDAREALRHAVVSRERARRARSHDDAVTTSALFQGMVGGRYSIVDRFERDGRRYIVALENASAAASLRKLTRQEQRIAEAVARGEPLKRIALDLGITPGAAGSYLASVRKKLGVRSRTELATWFADASGAAEDP